MLIAVQANDRFPATARLGRPLPGERRAEIVQAATTLFWQKGYHGASMQDIGEHVGMLKGSLYAHVANKEEILLEIVSTTFRRLMDAVLPLLDEPLSCAERLQQAVRAHASIVLGDPAAAAMFFYESRHLAGVPGSWVEDSQRRYMSLWQKLLQAGVDSSEFRPDLDIAAAAALAMSIGAWSQRKQAGTEIDVAEAADRFSALLLRACTG